MNIAILGRNKNDERPLTVFNENFINKIIEYNCNPRLIYINTFSQTTDISRIKKDLKDCQGLLLQGGKKICNLDKEIVKYAHSINMPVFGICLGSQIMACAMDGIITKLPTTNHDIFNENTNDNTKEIYGHKVKIDPNSKLFKIIKEPLIEVTSLHASHIIKTNLNVVASSEDNINEAFEDKTKNFFLGVQWHPELSNDIYSKRLFDEFFKQCKYFKDNHS